MNNTILYLFLVMLLVAADRFFVAAEFSLASVDRKRIRRVRVTTAEPMS